MTTKKVLRALALAPLLLVALATLEPSRAAAQEGRPYYVGFGVGGHAFVTDNWRACCDVRLRVQGELGWHPGGRDSGFFLAGEAIFTIDTPFLLFMSGLRLGGDIEVHDRGDLTVFLRPSVLLGGGLWDPDDRVSDTLGFFVVQPAFDIRLALGSHVVQLWLRPVGVDLMFFPEWPTDRDYHFVAAYVFQAGLDFTF